MEPLIKHQKLSKSDAKKRALDILELVGLPNAKNRFNNFHTNFQVDKDNVLLLQRHWLVIQNTHSG